MTLESVRTSESVRLDRWLWSVRLTSTRSDAAAACSGGHVEVNGRTAKPATHVAPGDKVEGRLGERVRIVEVVKPIEKRVGAAIAATCFVDHSPPVERDEDAPFRRDRGTGRPTKRDRRRLERWRAR